MAPNTANQKLSANWRSVLLRFLILFLPVAVFLTIVVYFFYLLEAKNEKLLLTSEQSHQVDMAQFGLSQLLEDIVTDTLVQAMHYTLQNWPEKPGPLARERLAGEFQDMAQNTRMYSGISFADLQGQELVRVTYKDDKVIVDLDKNLQTYAASKLFKRAISLQPGQVSLTAQELYNGSAEDDEIHQNLVSASAVFDRQGQKRGVVMLSYRADRMVQSLRRLGADRGYAMLLDGRGRVVVGPGQRQLKKLGMKGTEQIDFAAGHAQAWRIIDSLENGQFFDIQGLFTFAKIDTPKGLVPMPNWKIVTLVPAVAVDAAVGMYLHQLSQMLLLFLLVAGVICWFLAQTQMRHRLAQAAVLEKQRHLDEDLKAASGIQRALLPSAMPDLPQIELAWQFVPSQLIGGDLFNAYALDERHLALYMLDVSGHGVPAALVTVAVHETLDPQSGHVAKTKRDGTMEITPPVKVLELLDREYPLERFEKTFTIFYMLLDLASGQMVYSSAGHPPPYLLRAAGGLEKLDQGGTLIGLDGVVPFEEGRLTLAPGDKLVLYTDGVIEYANSRGALYGAERLESLLQRRRNLKVSPLLEQVWHSLVEFGGYDKPEDDVSLLGLNYLGSGVKPGS